MTDGRRCTMLLSMLLSGCGTVETHPADMTPVDLVDCKKDPVSCGFCATDQNCGGNLPRCDTTTGQCVACLPQADNCGPGLICATINGVYSCVATCTQTADCLKLTGGGECCEGTCRNTMTDTAHCGGCGRPCRPYDNADAVCTGGACSMGPCHTGFANCNKTDADGCEIDTNGDVDNCGGCGMSCGTTTNGTAICQTGACMSMCNMGYADCDNKVANGCEVDTSSDPNNCGMCGKGCKAPANAIAACDGGKCSFRCKPHFFDCDGNAGNGCEVDASQDANNCGHCGNICPSFPNAGPGCANSFCFANCNMGFGDCDKNPANGCESSLATDLKNCGGCGKACNAINGAAACAMGACTLTCNQPWADCDMDGSNGCESNPNMDAKNCAGCGNACPMDKPYCSAAQCTDVCPVPAACKQGNDAHTFSQWVICQADCSTAWVSTLYSGTYHSQEICGSLGYSKVGQFGSTCGWSSCGRCQWGTSCNNPGNQVFDGAGNCGQDQWGQILCGSVMWTCVR